MQPSEHQHIERVSSRIGPTIVEFISLRGVGATFHAEELHQHVALRTGRLAPASADRILRSLRCAREVNYRVLDRFRSLYEILPVEVCGGPTTN